MKASCCLALIFWMLAQAACAQPTAIHDRFDFGSAVGDPSFTSILPTTQYSDLLQYGFDLGTRADNGKPFYFSVAVPEGNYLVTVTLGSPDADSTTTVKAESRRLMLERIHTAPGQTAVRTFAVNVRTPQIAGGGEVNLDSRENGTLTWDNKLTLEFSGQHPSLQRLEIQSADVITVFTCGDSTVTDQMNEPYGTWAQILPRWFGPEVAVANHAESGETLKAFRAERRWDKVFSQIKPGDFVFLQFGTNDMKKSGLNPIYPGGDFAKTYAEANTEYKALLKQYAAEVQQRGGTPVIVSPMARATLHNGKSVNTLGDYPKAAEAAAREAGCPFIDLNGMSAQVYEALGPKNVGKAFVDMTHTDTYGGYLLSRCVVEGIKRDKLDLARYIVSDARDFDPAKPAPLPGDFLVPVDPRFVPAAR